MTEIKVSVPMAPELHARIRELAKEDKRAMGAFIAKRMEDVADQAEKAKRAK